jgi:hypothetical protein
MANDHIDWKALVEGAARAPSGDNTQPWEVGITGNTLELYYVPIKEQSLYDVGNMPDYLALGAWLHNFKVLAADQGYHAQITLYPAGQTAARVILESGSEKIGDISAIFSRRTNRFPYEKNPIAPEQKTKLEKVLLPYDVSVTWIEGDDKKDLERIGPELHRIFWEFDAHKKSLLPLLKVGRAKNAEIGIHRSHMGISFGGISTVFGLLIARHVTLVWKIVRIITSTVEKRNLTHSGTIAILKTQTPDGAAPSLHRDFWMTKGMALEEFWLALTEDHLAAQPFYTIIVFGLHKFFHLPPLSQKHQLLERRANDFLDTYRTDENTVAFMCLRIGVPRKIPKTLSLRKPFEKIVRT